MPPKRTTISTFLSNADQLTIELKKMVMDPSELSDMMKKYGESSMTKSIAKLYHRASKGFDIKVKIFGSTQSSMFNEQISSFSMNDQTILMSTKQTPINNVPQTADSIKLIRDFDYIHSEYDNWIIRFELVKTIDNPLEFKTKLSTCKSQLVDATIDTMSPDAYDYVSINLIQTKKEPLTVAQLNQLIESVFVDEDKISNDYQSAIFGLASDIFRDAVLISQFKRKSGFKRLCSNTIELSRPIYFKQVLPIIDQIYITDKMDGTRGMLIIDEYYRRSGHRRISLGANIYAVSDKVYEINNFTKPSNAKTIECDHTVLDVEIMNEKEKTQFYCFDVIALESKRLSGFPFQRRFETFDTVKTIMEKYDLGTTKQFVKLSKDTFKQQIKDFYNQKRSYHIDGLVFTPQGTYFKDAIKAKQNKFDKIFNTEYSNTISFKWKPLDQLTIDFYMMAHPKRKGSYVLCSGVDIKTFNQLRLEFFDGYVAPESPNAHKYFPIQFEPYDNSFDYIWTPTKEEVSMCESITECKTFNGLVGEFRFADGDKILQKPRLNRLRVDRIADVARGEYYGNALKYSELIYSSIQHPLTVESLYNPTDMGYFATTDMNDWYKAQRNFNSFVKTNLMETYLQPNTNGTSRIMDIACGKGQDLARAIDLGFGEIIAMDKDADAIYELLDRKYNLRVKRKDASANIHIKKVDLEDSAKKIIETIKIKPESVDAAMINFAIHYICHSPKGEQQEPLTEFIKFNSYFMKKGARLMITAFNGQEIFSRLSNVDEFVLKEFGRVKYSIKREFSSDTFSHLDQSIGVMLPFSDGYYSEYLVNYEYLQTLFEKHGFRVVRGDSFASLLRLFKKINLQGYQQLTDVDKEWVSLYSYMIVEKL